ncbi:hypothetical protein AAVH_06077 [Aphelenchoides avenae]|nr:hypothetical protein AAVH_06077 [Aphelenchus avenae]
MWLFQHKNQRVTFSVPANNQELLSHFKQNYPHLKTLAENVLRDSRDSDTLVEDMLGALEKRAGLLKRTLRTLGASLKTDINRRKKISADIDVKQRQYADCCHKIEEIEKAIAEDEPLTPDGRPARVHLGNRINQIRLLQKIFGH